MKLNKQLILEDFSSYMEEVRKRQKMGQPPMSAEEKHSALLRSMGKKIEDKAETELTKGRRASVNSDAGSDMGGALTKAQAENMKRQIRAAGF